MVRAGKAYTEVKCELIFERPLITYYLLPITFSQPRFMRMGARVLMTTTISFVKPVSQIRLAPGSIVSIPNVSWQEFEAIING